VTWLDLPEPLTFEPGLALRRMLLPEQPSTLPEVSRYSYQPGDTLDYEIAERSTHIGYGMADISIVRECPRTLWAGLLVGS